MQWNGNFKGKEYYYHMHVAPQFASTMQKIAWALTCSFLWSYCSNLNCFKHKILTNFLGLDFPFTHLDHGPWCILLLSISSRISSFDKKRGLWTSYFQELNALCHCTFLAPTIWLFLHYGLHFLSLPTTNGVGYKLKVSLRCFVSWLTTLTWQCPKTSNCTLSLFRLLSSLTSSPLSGLSSF
jgi:hypothetical protein